MRTVAFCEIDPYCRAVLRKHWPDAPIFEDVRDLTGGLRHPEYVAFPGERYRPCFAPACDVICGGFPCQDISAAGFGAGIDGERSGLWREYARLIDELRPRFVIVENVSALLGRGLSRVLGDLATLGYDAEWDCIPAAAIGAPHIRDRVWILAYPGCQSRGDEGRVDDESRCANLLRQRDDRPPPEWGKDWELVEMVPGVHPGSAADWWARQSAVARSVNGIPRELVDARNRALGNSIVPQIAEAIGRAIMTIARTYLPEETRESK